MILSRHGYQGRRSSWWKIGELRSPLVVLVAVSRVAGGYHSSIEVLAGALLGGGVPLAVFLLFGLL